MTDARSEQARGDLPIDSDVDLTVAPQRAELRRAPARVLLAVAVGGALGGMARYGLGVWAPVRPGGFPWSTFAINVSGCLLIGALMVVVAATNRPLLRPFVGTGMLGGYTTFSTYAVETQRLIADGAVLTALGYLFGTLAAALVAVYLGLAFTRWALR